LNPDIIITTRLWKISKKITEYIDKFIFGKELQFEFIKGYGKKSEWNYITLNSITLNRKKIPLIDMGHFSKPGRNFEKDFYSPLMRILKSDSFKDNFPKLRF
jgi:hypothetical protein